MKCNLQRREPCAPDFRSSGRLRSVAVVCCASRQPPLDSSVGRARAPLASPTWQPTELVHEAFLKLCGLGMDYRDCVHFLAMAATAMRQLLVDHARSRKRDKRGGGERAVTLNTNLAGATGAGSIDVLDLDRALHTLATLEARKARAIELSYFGGLADRELAEVLEVSEPTVKRDLRSARPGRKMSGAAGLRPLALRQSRKIACSSSGVFQCQPQM